MYLTFATSIAIALPRATPRPASQAIPELLSTPATTVLRCRCTKAALGAHAVTVEIDVGRAPDPVTRTIRITFDSAGRPSDLLDAVTVLDREHGISMYTASARMSATRITGWTVIHERSWSKSADRLTSAPRGSVRGAYVALSKDQSEKARTLAAWIWEHRCPESDSPAPTRVRSVARPTR